MKGFNTQWGQHKIIGKDELVLLPTTQALLSFDDLFPH